MSSPPSPDLSSSPRILGISRCIFYSGLAAVSAVAVGAQLIKSYKLKQNYCCSSSSRLLNLNNEEQIKELQNIFPILREEFLSHIKKSYEFPEFAINRLRRMIDYTVIGGKYNRACLLLQTVQIMCKYRNISIENLWKQSLVCAWCIEILQALFLVADDIMDKSVTRRSQPCWYKLEEIQMDAINDTLILESFLFWLLSTHINTHANFIKLMQLYQNVSLQTQLGQMLDLCSQPQGIKDSKLLETFNLEMYERIVTYKTAIYTFQLPIQAGLLLAGNVSTKCETAVREISIELGKKFQIEDDYLDCYQTPEILGKIGTDIKDHKCSWLVVQALKLIREQIQPVEIGTVINEERRNEWMNILKINYGRVETENEEKIKKLYKEMKLENLYEQQEDFSYQKIRNLIKIYQSELPSEVFLPILEKIHKRHK